MKERLTLNQTWKLCLRQWKWVIDYLEEFGGDAWDAKTAWAKKYFPNTIIKENCFFCEYNSRHGKFDTTRTKTSYMICTKCPGRLVDRKFVCENISYDWCDHPKRFYKKLLALNKKRKG